MQRKGIDNISLNRLERYNHPSTDKRYSLKKPFEKNSLIDLEINFFNGGTHDVRCYPM